VVLNKRERYIAIGMSAAVFLLIFNSFVWNPYWTGITDIQTQTKKAQDDYDAGQATLHRQARLQPVWKEMLSGGLRSDESLAQSTSLRAFGEWARYANVNFDSERAERAVQQGQFYTMAFNVDFGVQQNNSERPITQFLWAAENASVPMRINKVTVSSVKEGTENLTVKLNLSTLYMPPDQSTGGESTVNAAAPAVGS
jgi:hypothetical protein